MRPIVLYKYFVDCIDPETLYGCFAYPISSMGPGELLSCGLVILTCGLDRILDQVEP